ncbi:3D domain-containing protein [Aneurinibacillus sp. Ricciae_BoGa-3]|uniref:3D domain-containing protein n=1 Tax=Aneurinibacillus sp. Ricciae_BoGa-3 TaxID=3022697 RepID=UPI0023425C92|nr:3D domain-containing protein [Aneurinibacillus sp. Ricciae_BoGa-3]WCK53768.1 3D domain-containing protein [Aneurinibacillus sp. Ricciae_BoGa-3]
MNSILKNVKPSLPYLFISIVFTMLGLYILLVQPQATREPAHGQSVKKTVQIDKHKLKTEKIPAKPVSGEGLTIPVQSLEQYPKVSVVATGYYPGPESTGKDESHPAYKITYSGVKVRRDRVSTIAADLHVFPLGTVLYIPGYGYGIVADIGSAIKGNKLDLYFEKKQDVFKEWGKKQVDVYIIEKGKGKVSEAMVRDLNQNRSISKQ